MKSGKNSNKLERMANLCLCKGRSKMKQTDVCVFEKRVNNKCLY